MNPKQFNYGNNGNATPGVRYSPVPYYLKALFIIICTCICSISIAQRRSHAALTYGGGGGGSNFDSGYGVMLGMAYDAPLGNLKGVYKPAVDFNLGVARFMDKFTVSFTLGYHAYKPKNDTTNTDEVENTNVVYSNYKVYSAYAGIIYNLNLSESARLYGGANLGLYYTHYAYTFVANNDSFIADLQQQNFYMAPRLGIIFALTNTIGLSFESKYNFFSPIGKSETESSGTFYTSVAGQAALTYKF
ncbi:hypothetical protein [Mucilaginibacter pocheonensis]|uniref:Outer membrane protein beta-barrel domain-containing protein n=1 Tax=Mucilaginibacter pocheonensis TaxID=398050 RepID=A0ABU1TH93_9SPHI|nr:hypothetical protein [Mucilaginibacter pocheonensis]MDR6944669.1 hypothetical protein [Mucilaginibacter pocheonensis]